jgi:hypothetical protein
MLDPAHFYQHLGDGISWVLIGCGLIWAGVKKKAFGKNTRPIIFVGSGFIIYGVLALLGLI